MHFTVVEHTALRRLLLDLWIRGRVARSKLSTVAGLPPEAWTNVAPLVLLVLLNVGTQIVESRRLLPLCRGQRLPDEIWRVVRAIAFERDGYACAYCGSTRGLEGDHIIPLSRGGGNMFENIATACKSCNAAKGTKSLREWRRCLRSHQ